MRPVVYFDAAGAGADAGVDADTEVDVGATVKMMGLVVQA